MSLESALALIESVAHTECLFIGEAIRDEYIFVSPLAKPPKENCLAVQALRQESYEGGVHAARAHAASFCLAFSNASPGQITKTRYVDDNYGRKLFEVQKFDGVCVGNRGGVAYYGEADVTAITDFGHGGIDVAFLDYIRQGVNFLAVATQTNAANAGYNLITKYARADYIVIDEPEARLAAQDRTSSIDSVLLKLAKGRCDKFIITRGRHGAIGWDGKTMRSFGAVGPRAPLDTMGAGDAFFAVTAPMARTGSMEDLLLIGNAAGYLKTQILGHRESVTKQALIGFLRDNCPH